MRLKVLAPRRKFVDAVRPNPQDPQDPAAIAMVTRMDALFLETPARAIEVWMVSNVSNNASNTPRNGGKKVREFLPGAHQAGVTQERAGADGSSAGNSHRGRRMS